MRRILAVLISTLGAFVTRADWPFPSAEGTVWQYALTREPTSASASLTVTRRVVGDETAQEQNLLRIETAIDGTARSSELFKNEGTGVVVTAAKAENGKTIRFDTPVTVLPQELKPGASWNFRGEIATLQLELPLRVTGEEKIEVPAGKFQAWHIRGEERGSFSTVVDEWFVPGVGSVKETVTQRSPTGELLVRNTLELLNPPAIANSSSPQPLEVSVSTSTAGEPVEAVSVDALQIVARWRVNGVSDKTKLRVVWVAEDLGELTPGEYKIDEATAVASSSNSVGAFTLARPPGGWEPGNYRVDFYLGNVLAQTVKLTIGSSD